MPDLNDDDVCYFFTIILSISFDVIGESALKKFQDLKISFFKFIAEKKRVASRLVERVLETNVVNFFLKVAQRVRSTRSCRVDGSFQCVCAYVTACTPHFNAAFLFMNT